MELSSGVHVITVGEGRFMGVYPPNVYVVLGKDSAVIVDSGYDREDEYKVRDEYMASLGNPHLSHVILTHRHLDHMGGAAHFHRLSGGTITCSPDEREAIDKELKEAHVGQVVQEGETLELGGKTLEFIHTPGHTLGSLCILLREEGALFTGDTILGTGTTVVNPGEGSMTAYITSLRKLQGYDLASMLPGHGPVVNNPVAKLNELIAHRLEREEQIVTALQRGPQSLKQLFDEIYPELAPGLHGMAQNQIRAHLIKLEQEQRTSRVQGSEETYALA